MAEQHSGFEGTGNIDLNTNSKKLTCPDPTADQEAATKKYHDDNLPASLWEVDGTETQLVTPDEIDMQDKDIKAAKDITMAGYFLNIMAASDVTGMYIDGGTTPYSGSSTTQGIKLIKSTAAAASANAVNQTGFSSTIGQQHTLNGTNAFVTQITKGGSLNATINGAHSIVPMFMNFTEQNYGLEMGVLRNAGIHTGGSMDVFNYGTASSVTDKTGINAAGKTVTVKNYGSSSILLITGTETAGTLTKTNYGNYIKVTGIGTNYGLYVDAITGGATHYAIYTNAGDVRFGDDTYWEGAGSGLPFGSCSGYHIAWTQVAAQNTWYNVSDSDMIDGQLNLVTHDGSGKLTVAKAGVYKIDVSLDIEVSAANKHTEIGFEITGSGSAATEGIVCKENVGANNEFNMSTTALLSLAANATIELCVRTTDIGTPTISVDCVNLNCVQIGGN